ncbi:hypothetical protein EDD65_102224 [Keratinibaculum paraultunense]|uniref:Uncharacterized protein n=1 Tax=Keratinibaculum paraultunense TaxID=1278232 RepID=A0A4R3KYQ0_9FIRM|nr:hypothetical protein [Keratinibaculum paraultunense]QQY80563.1 hypothetical protein JL105_04485 [Keratinibaculum paraultunense]TCS91290.1 hypothetical protein EDD65_102224 [Keratinibaculum paraultunense]
MKRSRIYLIIFVIIFALFSFEQTSYGSDYKELDYKLYIIVVNRLTLPDIEKMPNIKGLIDEGNIGLMNTRGVNGYKGAESFATINASAKTYANNESSQLYNLKGKYKTIYENRVGTVDEEYAIGNIQLGKLYNQNEKNNYSPHIGAIGDSIHSKGLKTAAFGNSDTDEEAIRTGALIAMDSKGLIDLGNVDDVLLEDINYPYGIKTDYEKILLELSAIEEKASLLVIDTGDLDRLNSYSDYLSIDIFQQKRDLILNDIDNFVGNLLPILDKENSMVMIISPNAGEDRIADSRLSPIIMWGKEIKKGTITSSTTNREGIISNLDIGPTIAQFLQAPIDGMTGNPIESIKKEDSFKYIKTVNNRVNTTSKVRSKTLLIYGIIIVITMLLTLVLLIFNIDVGNKIGIVFNRFFLLLYTIPMIFIFSSLLSIDNLLKYFVSLFVFIIIFWFIFRKYNNSKCIYYISIGYFVIFLLDLITKGSFTRYSIISHDPIIGARYFGMGNEMAGIFIAIATLIAGLLLDVYENKYASIALLLLSIIMIGHPKLGANVGGTMAILSATIYFMLLIMGKKLNIKNLILFIFITGIAITILGYIDTVINPNPTHLGKTISLIEEKGIGVTQNIIGRKLLMNIKLIGASVWTKVIFIDIVIQVVLSYVYKNRILYIMEKGLGKGILSGIIGSLIGLLLNDSGIILSALSMNLITLFLLFIVIGHGETYINGSGKIEKNKVR